MKNLKKYLLTLLIGLSCNVVFMHKAQAERIVPSPIIQNNLGETIHLGYQETDDGPMIITTLQREDSCAYPTQYHKAYFKKNNGIFYHLPKCEEITEIETYHLGTFFPNGNSQARYCLIKPDGEPILIKRVFGLIIERLNNLFD